MKNDTNIYDIDGELIRKAGDTHKITIEEAQKMMENYRQKLQNIDENDKKAVVYATYMRNLSNYIFAQYAINPEELNKLITTNETTTDQIEKSINELKRELEEGAAVDNKVEQTVGESVVEDKPIVMDEYVDFEEIPA